MCATDFLPVFSCTNGFLHDLMACACVCVLTWTCICMLLESNVCATMCQKILTQNNEVDLVPLVLPPALYFTVVHPRVGQQQVTDQQGGISAQVLPSKGQTAGLAARGLVGVHLAPEEGNDLEVEEILSKHFFQHLGLFKPKSWILKCHVRQASKSLREG